MINKNKKNGLLVQIEEEIEKKAYWRARELFHSLTKICGYDKDIYKNFADLLFLMHEKLQAGRYYYLSGFRGPEANECIELFLDRYKRKSIKSLKGQFPSAAQKMKIDEFPEPIKTDFIDWGFKDEIIDYKKQNTNDKIVGYIFFGVIVSALLWILYGFFLLIKFIIKFVISF